MIWRNEVRRPGRVAVASLLLASGLLFAACGGESGKADGTGTTAGNGATTTAGGGGGDGGGDAKKGEPLFQATCSACHGKDAKGVKGLGKDLTTSAFVKSQTDKQLVDFIKVGRPADDPANTTGVAMPPKGGNPALTDEQLYDIVAYIRTLEA